MSYQANPLAFPGASHLGTWERPHLDLPLLHPPQTRAAPGASHLGTWERTTPTRPCRAVGATVVSPALQRGVDAAIGLPSPVGTTHSKPITNLGAPGPSHSGTGERTNHKIAILLLALFALIPSLPAHAQRFTVVLDAAHGGDDLGATLPVENSANANEKDATLALSVRLRSLLAARGIAVVTTRENDTALDSQHRAEIANHAQAQACILLHASTTGTGIHLFFSSLPPAQAGHALPWSTAQSASVQRSIVLAGVLNASLRHAGMKVTLGRASVNPIDSLNCPAVAVEVAPESQSGGHSLGPEDSAYQSRVAEALAAALVEWRSANPAEPRQP